MCLTVKRKSIRVKARIDKVCYKHLIMVKGELLTPYQRAKIEIGGTYESKLRREDESGSLYDTIDWGLHSFKNLDSCVKDVNDENKIDRFHYSSYHRIIVKCIIPKGSYYYKGDFNNSISYASDKITYLEILETYHK